MFPITALADWQPFNTHLPLCSSQWLTFSRRPPAVAQRRFRWQSALIGRRRVCIRVFAKGWLAAKRRGPPCAIAEASEETKLAAHQLQLATPRSSWWPGADAISDMMETAKEAGMWYSNEVVLLCRESLLPSQKGSRVANMLMVVP